MKKSNYSFEDFVSLILIHTDVRLLNVVSTTRIAEDLKIYGDDADELLLNIHVQFGTDFLDFPYTEYFANECSPDMNYISLVLEEPKWIILKLINKCNRAFWWMFKTSKVYKSLTVGELYEAVQKGKWHQK